MSSTQSLRALLQRGEFLHMPSVHDALSARLMASIGFKAAYVGGFVTGASQVISEPLLTMTEQVQIAQAVAVRTQIPVLADAGAGWGDALHTMRTVREFIRAGIAGVHIEDQVFPKRAHYHKYVAHAIAIDEFVEKIDYACRERQACDPDFVIISRTDVCRTKGVKAAAERINATAQVGADLGLIFPRNDEEVRLAPKLSKLPLIYVQSLGNRDGRPLLTADELRSFGYAGCIEAQFVLCTAFHYVERAARQLLETGRFNDMTAEDYVVSRKRIEDLIGLEDFYQIEQDTVEARTAQ
ncbi:isocitrate lyase/PEP mutase family protein [Alcaligenaceae bacterium]|nr:isocitrate lyase/PEP mutase family protein [Alcaligenaceae bacterium]